MRAAILTAANTTSALVWTAITMTWSHTGISAIYQEYKAAIRIRVGMSNPAKDITCLQTHFECLSANNAPVSAYKQGMILLSAIPDEWDHMAAYYMLRLQTIKTIVNSRRFKGSSCEEPRRVQVLDLYCLTRFEGENSRRGNVY